MSASHLNASETTFRSASRDNLSAKAHAFTEGVVLNALSDARLGYIIAHGGPALNPSSEMLPDGYNLREAEIAALTAHICAVADPPNRSKGAVYARN